MKLKVAVESRLKPRVELSPLSCIIIAYNAYLVYEISYKKHLKIMSKKLAENSLKEKAFFRDQRKEVEAGAHGTLNYTIKKGVNKNKIADEKILKSKK